MESGGLGVDAAQRTSFAGGGVLVRCPARKIELKADSAEQWGAEGRFFLVGHVQYKEPGRLEMTSHFLTFLQREEHIVATVDVVAKNPDGSTLTGQVVHYYQASRTRARDSVVAIGNPVLTLAQRDSAGKPQPPTIVKANTLTMAGDSVIYASQMVDVSRTDLTANGDSAVLDMSKETLRLMGKQPVINGKRERPYKLTGRLIDAYSTKRRLSQIVARGDAQATSETLTITADTIDFRVRADALERAIAWGHSRQSTAVSPTQKIIADSLDVLMPNQRLREVRAISAAYAESGTDSTRFRTPERDWLRGDTIFARFDSLAARDTTKNPPLRELLARSILPDAKAYYHLPAADTAIRRPAISYIVGRSIALQFANRRVQLVTVRDSVSGIYAEPLADSTARGGGTTPGTTGRGGSPPTPGTPSRRHPDPMSQPHPASRLTRIDRSR